MRSMPLCKCIPMAWAVAAFPLHLVWDQPRSSIVDDVEFPGKTLVPALCHCIVFMLVT